MIRAPMTRLRSKTDLKGGDAMTKEAGTTDGG